MLEVSLLGSYNHLKWLQAEISDLTGLPNRKPTRTPSNIRRIKYSGSTAINLCEWLYDKEKTIGLQRKKDKYIEYLNLDNAYGKRPHYNTPRNFDKSKLKI
jgi:hypothetical protein